MGALWPRRDARRDALAEQQLVRDLWQQVEARLDSSAALRAFLTQKIDDCGQTVSFEAFDLVRRVLNPDGFVRRAHKSADQNLGAAITMPESPWTAEGSIVDRQWDFNNAWMSQIGVSLMANFHFRVKLMCWQSFARHMPTQ